MLTVIACPECGVPAEITERFFLPSTDGRVEHVAVDCARGHHFRMAADRLPGRMPELEHVDHRASHDGRVPAI